MIQAIIDFWGSTGFHALFTEMMWGNVVMIAVSCVLLYLAIVKEFEPLLLVPIAFGMLLTNLPLAGLMADPLMKLVELTPDLHGYPNIHVDPALMQNVPDMAYKLDQPGGLLHYLYQGNKLESSHQSYSWA